MGRTKPWAHPSNGKRVPSRMELGRKKKEEEQVGQMNTKIERKKKGAGCLRISKLGIGHGLESMRTHTGTKSGS